MTGTPVELVARAQWREAVARVLDSGARFSAAWATEHRWNALFTAPSQRRVLWCEVPDRRVETIVDLAPAAGWDEREAHDLHELQFAGHDPLRPLVAHPADLSTWTTPVTGRGVNQVAVGPVHAGVIESGHFRFHVVGERILALDPRLFYKHRGLESAAVGLSPEQALAHAGRACAACYAANTISYAQAVEDALGLIPDRETRIARTLLLELERLYNHLHDISAVCAGVGFAPGTMAFAALKDRAQQLNAGLTGHRFLFGATTVAGSELAIDATTVEAARSDLRELRVDAAAAWRELEFAGPLQARLDGVGVLSHDDAIRLGAAGPAARAAGVHRDVRSESPHLWYSDFTPARLAEAGGDAGARLRIRAAELETTYDLLDGLLAAPITPGAASAGRPPARAGGVGSGTGIGIGVGVGVGVGEVESPRGATVCAVELAGDPARIARLHLRTGSYANWPALAHATTGNLLPDFPLINKSFELCYACVDR